MKNSPKTIWIISLLVIGVAILIATYILNRSSSDQASSNSSDQTKETPPPVRTDDEFLALITKTFPSYVDRNGSPTIRIFSQSTLEPHWSLVRIQLIDDTSDNYALILVKDPTNNASDMVVVAGPGTSFDRTNLEQQEVPESVIQAANR